MVLVFRGTVDFSLLVCLLYSADALVLALLNHPLVGVKAKPLYFVLTGTQSFESALSIFTPKLIPIFTH